MRCAASLRVDRLERHPQRARKPQAVHKPDIPAALKPLCARGPHPTLHHTPCPCCSPAAGWSAVRSCAPPGGGAVGALPTPQRHPGQGEHARGGVGHRCRNNSQVVKGRLATACAGISSPQVPHLSGLDSSTGSRSRLHPVETRMCGCSEAVPFAIPGLSVFLSCATQTMCASKRLCPHLTR